MKASILKQGLLYDPVVWYREGESPEYVVIDGAGRCTAIAAIIEEYEGADEMFENFSVRLFTGDLAGAEAINIVTGVLPEFLNPIDEADACARLVARLGNQADAAELLSRSPAWVSGRCQLATGLCNRARAGVSAGVVSISQARSLASYTLPDGNPDEEKQHELLDSITGKRAGIPASDKKKRIRTIRSKKEMEELRATLAGLDDPGLDNEHLSSVQRVIRWYFREVDTADVFVRESDVDEPVSEEEGAPHEVADTTEYKERERV